MTSTACQSTRPCSGSDLRKSSAHSSLPAFARLIAAQLRRFVVAFYDMVLLDTPLHCLVRPFDLGSLVLSLLPKHRQQDDPPPRRNG